MQASWPALIHKLVAVLPVSSSWPFCGRFGSSGRRDSAGFALGGERAAPAHKHSARRPIHGGGGANAQPRGRRALGRRQPIPGAAIDERGRPVVRGES